MSRRKRKGKDMPSKIMDEETIMRAVVALKKATLNSADYNRLAQQLKLKRSEIEKVANKMHPAVRVQRM